MRDLNKLSVNEARKFLNSFDVIVTDCDGVLWNLSPTPGVKEAIKAIYNIGKEINFITNNAIRNMEGHRKLFQAIGVQMTDANFIHPSDTARDYLVENNYVGKKVYAVAPTSTLEAFKSAGIQVVTGLNEYPKDLRTVLHERKDDPEVSAVFIDADLQKNNLTMFKAVSILHRSEVPLIFGATDKLIIPVGDKLYPGPGYFMDMITEPTGKKSVILGKPGKYLRSVVNKRFLISDPQRVLFIGDSLDQDIGFGSFCNFQTLLVLSGITTKEKMCSTRDENLIPDFYIESFADFAKIIEAAE